MNPLKKESKVSYIWSSEEITGSLKVEEPISALHSYIDNETILLYDVVYDIMYDIML